MSGRISTENDLIVLKMHLEGKYVYEICEKTGLSRKEVVGIINGKELGK